MRISFSLTIYFSKSAIESISILALLIKFNLFSTESDIRTTEMPSSEKSELLNAYPPTTETKSPKFPLIISHLPNNLFFVNL